jgi:hypothetical protein
VDSLKQLFLQNGYDVLDIKESASVGTIYCCASLRESSAINHDSSSKELASETFVSRAAKNMERVQQFIKSKINPQKKTILGIYVPLRFLPYLSLHKDVIEKHFTLRFFDDSPLFTGKYYDGFDVIVEPGINAVNNPPDVLLVCSHQFAQKILNKFPSDYPNEIYLLKNILTLENDN